MIEGSQCTVTFYVDDNLISHKNPKVVNDVIRELEVHFGKLTVTRGNKFDFLGMNILIRKDKKIEIEMKKQTNKLWNGSANP